MSISIAHTYLDELSGVATADVNEVKRKDAAYGGSWKKRGGIGAYMMMCRKIDRLEQSALQYGYDIFAAIEKDTRDESVLDDIRDLRRYLLLIEAEITARRTMQDRARAVDNFRPSSIEITGSGQQQPKEPMNPPIPGGIVVNPWLPPYPTGITKKYTSEPGQPWGEPCTLPPITVLHDQPSTVSRTDTVTYSPQTTTIAPPSNTWDREAELNKATEKAKCRVSEDVWPRAPIDCPCGDGSRQGHPATWCTRPSLGDF